MLDLAWTCVILPFVRFSSCAARNLLLLLPIPENYGKAKKSSLSNPSAHSHRPGSFEPSPLCTRATCTPSWLAMCHCDLFCDDVKLFELDAVGKCFGAPPSHDANASSLQLTRRAHSITFGRETILVSSLQACGSNGRSYSLLR